MNISISNDTCNSCAEHENSLFKKCGLTSIHFGPKSVIHFTKGENIVREGQELNGIYCIKEGVIKVFKRNTENKEFIVWLAKPGDIIGIDSFFSNENYRFTCQSLTPGKICFIPAKDFKNALAENQTFFNELVKILCERLNKIEERITNIAQKKIREQLADLLLILSSPTRIKENTLDVVSFSIKDLANIIGTTRNYLYKVLFDFSNKGFINIEKRKIFILDKLSLENLARKSSTIS